MAIRIIQSIQSRIYEIRGERVMLDRDLAAHYETETKRLAIKQFQGKHTMNRCPLEAL